MNEDKFKEQYRAGSLRAAAQKSKPEGFLENLSPAEKKARKEGFYDTKNELKQKAKNEVRDSLASTSSSSYDSYSSGSSSGDGDFGDFFTSPIKLTIISAVGALFIYLGWLGLTSASTFSLVWFLSLISVLGGFICLVPVLIWSGFILFFLLKVVAVLFVAWIALVIIFNVVKYFWNNLY